MSLQFGDDQQNGREFSSRKSNFWLEFQICCISKQFNLIRSGSQNFFSKEDNAVSVQMQQKQVFTWVSSLYIFCFMFIKVGMNQTSIIQRSISI